jgi:asparagine synthase (glutamine-hydrolysing)
VPRDQLVRPGRRRSLMRRALEGITPSEVLERPRKAFRFRSLLVPVRDGMQRIRSLLAHSRAAAMGLVDPGIASRVLDRSIAAGDPRWAHALIRLVLFELWLESLAGAEKTGAGSKLEFVA